MFNIRKTLSVVKSYSSLRGIFGLFCSLYLLLPFVYLGCFPKYILHNTAVPVSGVLFYPVEYLLLFGMLVFCRKKLRLLPLICLLGILTYAIGIAFSATYPGLAIYSACRYFLPLIVISQLELSSRDRDVLSFGVAALILMFSFQIIAVSLGLFSYYSEVKGAEVVGAGVFGAVRGFTTMGNSTESSVGIALLLTLYTMLSSKRGIVFLCVLAVGIAGTFFTFSRGGLFTALGVAGIALYFRKSNVILNWNAILVGSFSILLIVVLQYVASFFQEVRGDEYVNVDVFTGASGRYWRYADALSVAGENNYLGLGGSHYYCDASDFYKPPVTVGMSSPHNIYLLLLLEFGLFSALVFTIVLLLGVIRQLRMKSYLIAFSAVPVFMIAANVELVLMTRPLIYLTCLLVLLVYSDSPHIFQRARPRQTVVFE